MPPGKIKKQIVIILWEHELRIAAKALHKLRGTKPTKKDYTNAVRACYSALYHPDLVKDNPVIIMSAHK